MFSKYFKTLKFNNLLDVKMPNVNEAREIINNNFSLANIAKLLLVSENIAVQKMILKKASKQREKIWQNNLFLMPPLYLSNGDKTKGGCLDHCRYCSWHNGMIDKKEIIRLNYADTYEEAKLLLNLGYEDIELVAATDPLLFRDDQIIKYLQAVKNAGAKNIGINFFPLKDSISYSNLVQAGCTFTIVWQETYQADIYKKMHPRGPKANMDYRLDAHDRALQGGVKTVGLAFLGGLADWKLEILATIAHAQYLQKEYGANIIFGMPRWKKSTGINIAATEYNDDDYKFVGALYSLALPDSLVWFSTRENFDLSVEAAMGGGCLFTLDCSTGVGGYSRQTNEQFPVFSYPYAKGKKILEQLGFNIKTSLSFLNKKGE